MTWTQAARYRTLCLVSLALALALSALVLRWGVLPGEAALQDSLRAWSSPLFTAAARRVSQGGTWRLLAPAVLALLALDREVRRRWWLWAAALVVTPLVGEMWQELVGRRRPHGAALGFPSGHATAAAAFAALALSVASRRITRRPTRWVVWGLVALYTLAIGVSRLVLDAHWPLDVVVGFSLGIAGTTAALWWDATHPPRTRGSARDARDSLRRALCVAAVALVGVGCGQSTAPPPKPARPLVAASFYPLYEFARQVAGDDAEVVSLIPSGVEPHDWEPSAQDVALIQRARVFVYNGAGLEPWADKILADRASRGVVPVKATDGLALLKGTGADEPGKPTAKHEVLDPHVWLDPVLVQSEVEAIRAALAQVDPSHAQAYADRARAFDARLGALDAAFEAGLKQCARRDLVTSHAAFGYLARRYRLDQIPVLGLAPEAEPSPAEIAKLVQLARRRQVKYVFFETLVSPKLADMLAREVGAQTLVLNPLEGLTRADEAAGKSYVTLMEENLAHLRVALGCT